MDVSATGKGPSAGGVQSVHRALDLLELLAGNGGHMAIGEISDALGLPLPTTHRLLGTLAQRGFVRQLLSRHYALGFRLIPLAEAATALVGPAAEGVLADLVAELGESANLAILSGDHAEYVAQVSSHHQMRMFTEVGRRVELHSTGVGKALLSQLDDRQIESIVDRVGLPPRTRYTITTRTGLASAVRKIRSDGYAMDEQEQELGVRCMAVPLPRCLPSRMAISISGPLTRMDDDLMQRAVPLLTAAADRLAARLSDLA